MPLSAGLYLVSCVRGKLPCPAPAKDLYVSHWFQKARAVAESQGSTSSASALPSLQGIGPLPTRS